MLKKKNKLQNHLKPMSVGLQLYIQPNIQSLINIVRIPLTW